MTEPSNRTTHVSLRRAIALMRSFSEQQPSLTVSELSSQLALHKSTVSRILATLADEGLVYQNPQTGRYSLGLGLVTMSAVAVGQSSVRSAALPHLDVVARETNETSVLSVHRGDSAVTLAHAPSPESIRFVTWDGRITLLEQSAGGRLFTHAANLKHAKASIELNDIEIGMSSVSAPIFDHLGGVVAVISAVGPSTRFGPLETQSALLAVRKAAASVSDQVGAYRETPGVA